MNEHLYALGERAEGREDAGGIKLLVDEMHGKMLGDTGKKGLKSRLHSSRGLLMIRGHHSKSLHGEPVLDEQWLRN